MKAATTTRAGAGEAGALIDARIAELGDWRGEMLARLRALIKAALPGVTEEWKWNNPVWSQDGLVCTGESYRKVVKLTFAHGAALPDRAGLFNASLDGNVRRAIDFPEGAQVDEKALKALVKAAADFNRTAARARSPSAPGRRRTSGLKPSA
jgi:hypothetical protein